MTGHLPHLVRVLLVEDNPADAELMSYALDAAEVEVELSHVVDGEAALDFVFQRGDHTEAERPHLILLDLNLPGTDGRDVLRAIKGDPDRAEIPIVILTTSRDDRDIREAYRNHVNAYMAKPPTMAEMHKLVGSLDRYWFQDVLLPPGPVEGDQSLEP